MNSFDIPRGWFALGTFADEGRAFSGLVPEGERLVDILGEEIPGSSATSFSSTRQIFYDWYRNFTSLTRYVEDLRCAGSPSARQLASL